jgi:hypothetical protein
MLAAIAFSLGSLGELYPVKRVTQTFGQPEEEARLLQKAQEKRDRRAAKRLKDHHEH